MLIAIYFPAVVLPSWLGSQAQLVEANNNTISHFRIVSLGIRALMKQLLPFSLSLLYP